MSDTTVLLHLPIGGTKTEKIIRLCSEVQTPPHDLLNLFTADAIREVSYKLRIQSG